MGFWQDVWSAAKAVGKGVKDVFVGILEVMVLTVYAIGYVLFTIAEHLYNWIDGLFDSNVTSTTTGVTLVPEDETEKFIKGLNSNGKTVLPGYTPKVKRTLIVAHDENNKVVKAQVASTTKGFESRIQEAFNKGHLVEQPITTV